MSKQFQEIVSNNPAITKVWQDKEGGFYTFPVEGTTEVSREDLLAMKFKTVTQVNELQVLKTRSANLEKKCDDLEKELQRYNKVDETILSLEGERDELLEENKALAEDKGKLQERVAALETENETLKKK